MKALFFVLLLSGTAAATAPSNHNEKRPPRRLNIIPNLYANKNEAKNKAGVTDENYHAKKQLNRHLKKSRLLEYDRRVDRHLLHSLLGNGKGKGNGAHSNDEQNESGSDKDSSDSDEDPSSSDSSDSDDNTASPTSVPSFAAADLFGLKVILMK